MPRRLTPIRKAIDFWVAPIFWVYFSILFAWMLAYWLTGDRFQYVAIITPFAFWMFLPLLFLWITGSWVRRKELYWCGLVSVIVFGAYWGNLYVPRLPDSPNPTNTLIVMTYNLSGQNQNFEEVGIVIRREDAHIVLVQELGIEMADFLRTDLKNSHPYQILNPAIRFMGKGVFSKYPLSRRVESFSMHWPGDPQILDIDIAGNSMALVNFHLWPPGIGPRDVVEAGFREREAQAQVLVDFSDQVGKPIIIAGDANSAPLSRAYYVLSGGLKDAWNEAGFGPGFTFPVSGRLPLVLGDTIFNFPLGKLVRIDYVFTSKDISTLKAYIVEPDSFTDHFPVVALLSIPK